jgi:hypothetical protein
MGLCQIRLTLLPMTGFVTQAAENCHPDVAASPINLVRGHLENNVFAFGLPFWCFSFAALKLSNSG